VELYAETHQERGIVTDLGWKPCGQAAPVCVELGLNQLSVLLPTVPRFVIGAPAQA
jgi:hypothetical protein